MQPDRPPMDGNRSDDIGMLSCPVWLEHGEPDSNLPCMGMYLTIHELPWDLVFEEEYNENSCSTVRDGVYSTIQNFLEETYQAKPGYDISWNVQDISDYKGRVEVFVEVEFASLDGYRGDESLDDWAGRVIMGTPFYPVYNMYVILYDGRDEVQEALEALQLSHRLSVPADGAE
jgi:hypothetical protein